VARITIQQLEILIREAVERAEKKEKTLAVGALHEKVALTVRIDTLRDVLRLIQGDLDELH